MRKTNSIENDFKNIREHIRNDGKIAHNIKLCLKGISIVRSKRILDIVKHNIELEKVTDKDLLLEL